jgi:hypothetical protein
MIIGGYAHFVQNLKICAGYNFTDYSEKFTDVSYRSRGFIPSAVGKF